MNIDALIKFLAGQNCTKIYFKKLSPNDNSKNQVYLGGNFEVLNILPFSEITSDNDGDWKRTRFKTKLNFFWITEDFEITPAPEAQLILYPKYPEVRFSGFLKKVKKAPSDLMSNRLEGRILFLGVTLEGKILGYVASNESEIGREVTSLKNLPESGIFKMIPIENGKIEWNSRQKLIEELKRIHDLGWIDAKRLDSLKNVLPCSSSNCGGYTLEAELGITPNGYSEPDYLGWEIKQFGVSQFDKLDSSIITLMTPEPTGGYYVIKGIDSFIRYYGYKDKLGREARYNFGGIYKINKTHTTTGLTLIIDGYEPESKRIKNSDGYIGLVDAKGTIAASWSFSSLLKHWNTKHANACYVPSMRRSDEFLYPFSKQQYCFGNTVMLGTGTDFSFMLDQLANGNLYYDPGIKLELQIEGVRRQVIKRRSQFRIQSRNLKYLYHQNEIKDLKSET